MEVSESALGERNELRTPQVGVSETQDEEILVSTAERPRQGSDCSSGCTEAQNERKLENFLHSFEL
jgi:hypothetical protein